MQRDFQKKKIAELSSATRKATVDACEIGMITIWIEAKVVRGTQENDEIIQNAIGLQTLSDSVLRTR